METKDSDKLTIDLTDLMSFFKNNGIRIIEWGLLGLLIAICTTILFLTPKYSSSIDLLVNQRHENSQEQLNAQQADLQAIDTYKDVIKKDVILGQVQKKIKHKDNYDGSIEDLQKSVEVTSEDNSQVFTVKVINESPYVAADIANEIGNVFTSKIRRIMKVNNVSVVTKANVNLVPVSPNKVLYSLIGLLIGLVLGTSISLLKLLLNTTVQDERFLTEDLNLVNLGKVSHISVNSKNYKQLKVYTDEYKLKKKRV